MSGKRTPMDQAAKRRIMSSEYKKNDGKATPWSKRAQRDADKNERSLTGMTQSATNRNEYQARQSGWQSGSQSESGWWCVIL